MSIHAQANRVERIAVTGVVPARPGKFHGVSTQPVAEGYTMPVFTFEKISAPAGPFVRGPDSSDRQKQRGVQIVKILDRFVVEARVKRDSRKEKGASPPRPHPQVSRRRPLRIQGPIPNRRNKRKATDRVSKREARVWVPAAQSALARTDDE